MKDVKYVNCSRQLVILTLNTGETIHLAPAEVSRAVSSFEREGNPRIERLLRSGAVRAVGSSA